MAVSLVTQEEGVVARPLKVLVQLIKEDLAQAKEAAETAMKPFYLAVGEKLLEAKSQLAHGEFTAWVDRNFSFGLRQAQQYMAVARSTLNIEMRSEPRISDFLTLSVKPYGKPPTQITGGRRRGRKVSRIISSARARKPSASKMKT